MRTFLFRGRRYGYGDDTRYVGERAVEVPVAAHALSLWTGREVIEVGAVTPQWPAWFGTAKHRIVDLFEEPYEHADACEVDYKGKCVLSVSTIEHMGLADYGNTRLEPQRAITCLEKIVNEADQWFITWAIGYNRALDEHVAGSSLRRFFMHATDMFTWEETPERWDYAYGTPWAHANAVVFVTNADL